ncbi:MAG: pectinesterase family protein [Pseudomonadota bacterium]
MFPKKNWLVWALALSLLLVFSASAWSETDRRVALIIGNAAYRTSPLKNPVNDATDVAAALKDVGFEVILKTNVTRSQMREAFRDFGRQIMRGGVGLFYYSGHGLQVEGNNYLVPIDAKIGAEDEVQDECLDVNSVLRKMETAGNQLNIIILDACRDNPVTRSFRSGTRGLARMDAPTESILAYATSPGSVAADGTGRNGLYTSHFLKFVRTPGMQLMDVFMQVRKGVMDESQGKQVPWETHSVTKHFYFVRQASQPIPVATLPGPSAVKPLPTPTPPFTPTPTPGPYTPSTLPPATGPTIVVSSRGDGQYLNISDALNAAPEGARIMVRPGVYMEKVEITKSVQIIGDGPREQIILESTSNALVSSAPSGLVRGMTIRGRAATVNAKWYAVNISAGSIILENLDITSDSLACITFTGAGTNPTIRNCRIHDGAQSGFFIKDGAQGLVENCEIFANTLAGIEIKDGASPIIRNCRLFEGKGSGFFIHGNARPSIEGCDIYANGLAGIEIKEGASPIIRNCRIHDGKQSGMFIQKQGLGTIENCEVFRNEYTGIEIKLGGNPIVRNTKVYENKGSGIYVQEQGLGTLEKCQVYDNGGQGFNIKDGSNPTIRGCSINRNKFNGLWVHENSRATVNDSDITGNVKGAFDVDGTSHVDSSNNRT